MYRLIAVCVLLTALAGAEPPFYPFQQQRGDLQPYPAAGPPSGPLLLLPGEYVVPVNSPYQQYGVPNNEAQVNAPEEQYQAGFIATSQFSQAQQPFGQLQLAPGVQQPVFTAKFTAGSAPQPNEKDAEQFNPQVFNQRKQQQFNNDEDKNDEEQVEDQKPKSFRGTVKFTGPNQEDDSSEESVERYQQQDKYKQQRANGRYTSQQSQQQQQQQQYNNQQTNNQYYPNQQQQPNFYQPPNNPNQVNRANKYTPPRKYIPVNRAATTEYPAVASTTEYDDSTTTEIATSTEENSNDVNGAKSNYEENEDAENISEAQGSYYLLLPNGKLQKIVYMTADDMKKMQYVARIQYETIEPISGPIYAYNPKSAPFVQVF